MAYLSFNAPCRVHLGRRLASNRPFFDSVHMGAYEAGSVINKAKGECLEANATLEVLNAYPKNGCGQATSCSIHPILYNFPPVTKFSLIIRKFSLIHQLTFLFWLAPFLVLGRMHGHAEKSAASTRTKVMANELDRNAEYLLIF